MHSFTVASLGVFSLIPTVFTSLHALPQASLSQQGAVLRPINIHDYKASVGLQRRDSNDLSSLNPKNQAALIYGSTDDNGELFLANMTLFAEDGLPIILLEGFEELIISVDCRDNEGKLDLKFGSTDAFDHAKKQWAYVDEEEHGNFLLIANHDNCGSDDQRQGYIVSNITDDPATRTTSLAAKAIPWSEVAGSYDLDFGKAIPVPQVTRVKRNIFNGNFDESKTKTFSINAGTPNKRTNVYTGDGLTLDCINCYIAGKLDLTGRVQIRSFKLQDLSLTVSPNSVQAALELEATVSASGLVSHSYTKELLTFPIPDAGISIPEVIDLGATLVYSVGGEYSLSGSASVNFGGNTSLPDTAKIVADYKQGGSSATGFSSSELTPILDLDKASASITLGAFSQPEIQFGINLHEIGKVDMAIKVKLPDFSTTLKAEYDKDGECSHSAGASKTGITAENEIGIAVDFDVTADVLHKTASWGTNLWSASTPLPSACFPLSIPGLGPSSTTPMISTMSQTPTSSSTPTLSTTIPSSASSSIMSSFILPLSSTATLETKGASTGFTTSSNATMTSVLYPTSKTSNSTSIAFITPLARRS